MSIATKPGRVVASHLQSHMTFWSGGLARSREKLKALHLHYQSDYGQQTLPDANLFLWVSAHNVTRPFVHVSLSDHVTSQYYYISTTTLSMTTKFGMMVTYLMGILTIKSDNALILSPLLERLWAPNLPRC